MKRVVFGVYGSTLDGGASQQRWHRWRPTVALCRHDDLVIDRLELLHDRAFTKGAERVAQDIAKVSPETEVRLHSLPLADAWDFEEVFTALHELARSYRFDREREQYLVHITTGTHVMQICWFLLTESSHFPARLIQASPPRNRSGGDPGTYRIIDLDLSRYDRISTRFSQERADSLSFLKSGIDTKSAAFNKLIADIERVALRSREPILLTGPTGAGKSQLARQIYALKRARNLIKGELVEINCATLRGDGAMSALFGHKKGAYTGATRDRPGLLRSADGGMLFLDEIGELGGDEQAMLLRAIEHRRYRPVGSEKETTSDFQLIAGTNRELRQTDQHGAFREDLLARINLWTFQLPGLRDRAEDMAPNLDYELGRVGARMGRRVTMNKEAREHFLRFARSASASWPGNFRDFNAAITRMATLAEVDRIDVNTVQDEIARLTAMWQGSSHARDELASLIDTPLDRFDEVQLAEVVRVCRACPSLSEAGRQLFAVSRTQRSSHNDADRLRKYLARFKLSWAELHQSR